MNRYFGLALFLCCGWSLFHAANTKIYAVGGTAKGEPCVFPFRYLSKWYLDCTSVNSFEGRLWCSTTTDYDEDKKWGYCTPNLIYTIGEGSDDQLCVFPFTYKSKWYSECTSDESLEGDLWCATTANYTKDGKWRYCTKKGIYTENGNDNSKPCVLPFKFKSKLYLDCTTDGTFTGRPWCATTADYDRDKKWKYCTNNHSDTFLIYNEAHQKCLQAQKNIIMAAPCNEDNNAQRFRWFSKHHLINTEVWQCLGVSAIYDDSLVSLFHCDVSSKLQKWECKENALFGIKGEGFHLNYGNTEENVVISKGSEPWSWWTIYGTPNSLCVKNHEVFSEPDTFMIYSEAHKKCLEAQKNTIMAAPCKWYNDAQRFRWISRYQLINMEESECLGVSSKYNKSLVSLFQCDARSELQQWECKDGDLFGIKGESLHLNYDNTKEKVVIYTESGIWSQWRIHGTKNFLCAKNPEVFSDSDTFVIYNEAHQKCLQAQNNVITAAPCKLYKNAQKFRWTSEHQLANIGESRCLGVSAKYDKSLVSLFQCDAGSELQKWECKDGDLFGIKGESLHLNYGNTEENVVLFGGSGVWSQWKIWGTPYVLCAKAYNESDTFLIYNEDHNICLEAQKNIIIAAPCKLYNNAQRFRWLSNHQLINMEKSQCLGVSTIYDKSLVSLYQCDTGSELQKWECKGGDLFGIKGESFHLNYGNTEENVVIFKGLGIWSRWKIYGTNNALCAKAYKMNDAYNSKQKNTLEKKASGISLPTKDAQNSEQRITPEMKTSGTLLSRIYNVSGSADGQLCVFPFKYKSKWYSECTSDGSLEGRLWCSTTANYTKDGKWGYCPKKVIYTYKPCVIPFKYKGKWYLDCTTDGSSLGKHWCATTADYDKDQQWGYCSSIYSEGGNANGQPCVFPFKYESKWYLDCTTDGSIEGRPWCATTADYDEDKKWGYCPHNLIYAVGGNDNGQPCVFPFKYKSKSYTECIRHPTSKEHDWCATTADYDKDKKWGYCTRKLIYAVGGKAKGEPCVFPFQYNSTWYWDCTRDAMNNGRLWCATTANLLKDKKWGFCTRKLIYIVNSDSGFEPCVFPFKYKSKFYSDCTSDGASSGRLWCATTPNYDQDMKWGYCTLN